MVRASDSGAKCRGSGAKCRGFDSHLGGHVVSLSKTHLLPKCTGQYPESCGSIPT